MSKLFNSLPRTYPKRKPLRISTDISLFSYDSPSDSSSPANQSTSHPVATPITSSPRYLCHVVCMHDFSSSDSTHLSFCKDEVLIIVKQEQSGWWAAMRPQGDRIGWIPSSFVMPLDRCGIVDYPDETLVPPLSAVHGPWVPASDGDDKVLIFQLLTPTELILNKVVFGDSVRNHNDESPLDLSHRYHKRSSNGGVPTTPESLSPCRARSPQSFLSKSRASELVRSATPSLRDAKSFSLPHLYIMGD